MCRANCITFTLIHLLNLITGYDDFKLELTPAMPVIRAGNYLKLTCRINGCLVNATFKWIAVLDKSIGGEVKDEQTVSYLLFRNISTEHSNRVVCRATCGGTRRDKGSVIKVFSFPEDPVLPRIKRFEANKEQRISCTVHNIYPLDKFKIEWLQEDESLHVNKPDISDYNNVQNYSSVFSYTPSVADLGKNISCKVTLDLDGLPSKSLSRTSTLEYGPGTVTVSSNNTLINLGENLEITCHADGNPKPRILWRKIGESVPIHSQNQRLVIHNASRSQAGWYQCEASNVVGSLHLSVKVIVQGPPDIPKIHLSHRGDPSEGDNITILCSSESVSAALTLYRQSQNRLAGGLNRSTVLLNIPSIQITHGGVYICEAENDFGIERSMINITVKAPPRDPRVEVFPSLQVMKGQNVTVHTTVKGFPHPSTILRRERDGYEIQSQDGVFHLLHFTSDDEGSYTVMFMNELGNESHTFQLSRKTEQHNVSEMPDLPMAILPAAASVSLLTVAALLIRYLRKARSSSSDISMN